MKLRLFISLLALLLLNRVATSAEPANVTLSISPTPSTQPVNPLFLGLSYEMRIVDPDPATGKYYFDPNDENLVRIYQTLGIKSLRVGANAVDQEKVPVPDTKEIDQLFTFAKKAGCKVIYSFRLKKGDPANAARLAAYINDKYKDTLDCFSIGNEPDFYLKTYEAFRDQWKPIYEAILKAVPDAQFDGPATSRKSYSEELANDFFPQGHLSMVSTHTYPLGNGRDAEKKPEAARARFASNKTLATYQHLYDAIVKPLAARNIPYRMDETNSCFGGGAKDCSDSYASALWILDYLNWWAQHSIVGLNFHTGDTVNGYPIMRANYAIFVHNDDNKTFQVRPAAYGVLAFSQSAQGKPIPVKLEGADNLDFTAYAYQHDDGTQSIILLNKTAGTEAKPVTVQIQGAIPTSHVKLTTLQQQDADLAAKTNVTLGQAPIDPTGAWSGTWANLPATSHVSSVTLKPASAVLLQLKP